MVNMGHSCFSCPAKACPSIHLVNDCFGCGRCRLWWIWFWVYAIPLWLVTYVTFIKGFSFTDLYLLIPKLLEVVVEDVSKSLVIIVVGLGFVVLWVARDRIRQILGIDDRNLIHVDTGKKLGFQVCVWSVVANQRDFAKAANPWVSNQMRRRNLDCGLPGFSLLQEPERNLLPGIGKPCNVFCRLAYGDNEPQASRIVRMKQIMRGDSLIPFKESFCLEMEADEESETLLHIEVRDQALIGAQELGRVSFRVTELIDELERSKRCCERLRQSPEEGFDVVPTVALDEYAHSWMMHGPRAIHMEEPQESSPLLCCCGTNPVADDGKLGEAETQILWMMRGDSGNADRTKEALDKVGFKAHRLSKGGAIWLAFAWLDS